MERGRDFPSSLSSCKFPPRSQIFPFQGTVRREEVGGGWGEKTPAEAPSSKRSSQPLSSSLYLENVEHIMRQRRRRRLPLRSRLDASRAQKKFRTLDYYIDDKAVIRSPGPTFVASPPHPPKAPIHPSCPKPPSFLFSPVTFGTPGSILRRENPHTRA